MDQKNQKQNKGSKAGKVIGGILKTIALLIETVLLVAFALYCVMFVLCKGPFRHVGAGDQCHRLPGESLLLG